MSTKITQPSQRLHLSYNAGEESTIARCTPDLVLECDDGAMNPLLNKKGRFISATNDMDTVGLPTDCMLCILVYN